VAGREGTAVAATCGGEGVTQWPKHVVWRVLHSGRNMWSGGYCTVAETCGLEGTAQWPKNVVDINISNIIYLTVINQSLNS